VFFLETKEEFGALTQPKRVPQKCKSIAFSLMAGIS
jgi:hypothetical protein